jgi:hypothetical protein
VLGFIAKNNIEHVVFLSGDEHRGCVAKIQLRDKDDKLITRLHSIHTTAAYAPFPFANSLEDDFVKSETTPFVHDTVTYSFVVNANLPAARDGATLLRPWRDADNKWWLDYEYVDGGVQTLEL